MESYADKFKELTSSQSLSKNETQINLAEFLLQNRKKQYEWCEDFAEKKVMATSNLNIMEWPMKMKMQGSWSSTLTQRFHEVLRRY